MKSKTEETLRWKDQKWAVNPEGKIIFRIYGQEWIHGELIIYAGKHSNISSLLDTVNETTGLEQFRDLI